MLTWSVLMTSYKPHPLVGVVLDLQLFFLILNRHRLTAAAATPSPFTISPITPIVMAKHPTRQLRPFRRLPIARAIAEVLYIAFDCDFK